MNRPIIGKYKSLPVRESDAMGKAFYSTDDLERLSATMHEACVKAVSQATNEDYVAGLTWYESRADMLIDWAEQYGRTFDQTAAIMALLSPQLRYQKNATAALNMVLGLAPKHGLGLGVRRAYAVLDGADVRSTIGGQKVKAFFHNLRHPMDGDHVTIDVWMAKLGGLESDKALERKGAYQALAEGVKRAANDLGLIACQVQAIAWIVTRGAAL